MACNCVARHVQMAYNILMSQMVPDGALVKNARQLPKLYYGLHFYPGVVAYPEFKLEDGSVPFLLVTENAIRNMEPTFSGLPIYVEHIDGKPRLPTLQADADGYVIKSFFNKADGKHWAHLLIVSDAGHEAVARGFKLSNSYKPQAVERRGIWNSIPYQHELIGGEFEHMALVERPRYSESVILTPEQFAAHNEKCLTAINQAALQNSMENALQPPISITPPKKEGALTMAFNFFKKTPVEADSETLITLENGKTVSIEQLIKLANGADAPETPSTPVLGSAANEDASKAEAGEAKGDEPNKEEKAKQGHGEEKALGDAELANLDHHVMVNGASMRLGDVMASHEKMTNCMNALSEHYAALSKDKPKEDASPAAAGEARNDDGPALDPEEVKKFETGFGGGKSNSNSKEEDEFISGVFKGQDPKFFELLKNAHVGKDLGKSQSPKATAPVLDGTALGKSRYGSK